MPFDIKNVLIELERGFDNESPRRNSARVAREYYELDYHSDPIRTPTGFVESKFPRHSPFLRKVAEVLTQTLYKSGPERSMPDHPEATEWLNEQYKHCMVDALFQEADTLALVTDLAAFYVHASEDPEHPVEIDIYSGDELIVYTDDQNQRKVKCVVTVEVIDQQRVCRIWTDEELIVATTRKLIAGQTTGGTAYDIKTRGPNPYGVIPFAFVHYTFPTSRFWTKGIGGALREANKYINRFLTDSGETVAYFGFPIMLGKNIDPSWSPPSMTPGMYMHAPTNGGMNAGGLGSDGDLSFLQAELGGIEAGWNDLNSFMDHLYEMHGVPKSAIRLEQSSAASGISIVAEQLPLISWAESRQRPFAKYESDLAKLVLMIGSVHLANNAMSSMELEIAAESPGLKLKWPNMQPQLAGADRDSTDKWRLDEGIASKIIIIMERDKCTREEAMDYLTQVAEDKDWIDALFPPPALPGQLDAQGQPVEPVPGEPVPPPEPPAPEAA